MVHEYRAVAAIKMEGSRRTWRKPAVLMYKVTIKEIYVINFS
jgi:hypothetical protein